MLVEPSVKHVWRMLMMEREDAFNASVGSMNMYGALFKLVVKEVGIDRALKLNSAVAELYGDQMGKALKESLADKKFNIKDLNKVLIPMLKGWGISPEIKETSKSITLRMDKCPQYEGFKMAGLDHETIEKMCTTMSKAEYEAINKYIPELEIKIKFRESPKDACVEEFIIK
jgi:hypothetical protein